MRKVLLICIIAFSCKTSNSLEFLEATEEILLGAISQIDIAGIVRTNGGGCGPLAGTKKLDCVVGLDKLEVTKTQLVAKGLPLEEDEKYGNRVVSYYSSNPQTILRACETAFLNFHIVKVDQHLIQLQDEGCRNDPDGCDIKNRDPCDKDDCLTFFKAAFQKKGLITAADLTTLNTYKQLIINPANISNEKNLVNAFTSLKKGITQDIVSGSPKCAPTTAQCIGKVVARSPNPQAMDKVTNYSQEDSDLVYKSC